MRLIDGEELSFALADVLPTAKTAGEAINEKYVRGEIRIITEQARYPLSTISSMVGSNAYQLTPEYQRRHRWSYEQQSRLIESLIMNVPIPPVFLYEYDYSKYEVMDGLQRLTAIAAFYGDAFVLTGLTQWPELNGFKYSELPDKVREGIDRRYLSSVILLKETAKNEEDALRLKKMVFERINSGGTKLTPQETRNAIYDGALNTLCIRLSKNESLCRLWDLPIPEEIELAGGAPSVDRLRSEDFRRMEDVELVLRFFAFRQKSALHKGSVPLSVYLDTYLRHGNDFKESTLLDMEMLFAETIKLVEDTFGERAFWLYRKRKNGNWSWFERATTTSYDAVMAVMSQNLGRAKWIRDSATILQAKIEKFYVDNYSAFEGRNVNPSALVTREKAFENFLNANIVTE